MQFEKVVLPNKLRLITIPLKYTDIVTILVIVQSGSKYEDKGMKGISHFLEHMFFKGTKKRPSAWAIAGQLDAMGAEYNAFTHKEYTGYWIKARQKMFDQILDIISDIFQNSLFRQEEIEREKGVILEEMKMYQDLPMQYITDLFEKLLYGDQPAGWLIIGEKKSILRMNQEKILDYFQKHYGAQESIVLVTGKIANQDIQAKVKDKFCLLKDKRKEKKIKTREKQDDPQLLIYPKNTDQTHFILGFRGVDIFNPDRYSADLLAVILGGNMSSRLFIKLRERLGLAYYIKAENIIYTDSGYLSLQAGVAHANLQKSIQVILNELKLLKEKGIKQNEMKKAKEYLKGRLYLNLETSDEVAFWMGEQEAIKEQICTPVEIERKIDSVTEEQIIDFSRRILVNSGLNLAVIGPAQEEKELLKKLVI